MEIKMTTNTDKIKYEALGRLFELMIIKNPIKPLIEVNNALNELDKIYSNLAYEKLEELWKITNAEKFLSSKK